VKGISGKVYVQYAVNTTGEVVDVKVIRSANPLLDEEAVRVIKSSPKWEPAKQRGKIVKQQFTIPIAFTL
jgi:TonB family protein